MITESWLNDQIPDDILNIEGYQTIRNDRNHKRGGGVCIYMKQNVPYKRWIQLKNETRIDNSPPIEMKP